MADKNQYSSKSYSRNDSVSLSLSETAKQLEESKEAKIAGGIVVIKQVKKIIVSREDGKITQAPVLAHIEGDPLSLLLIQIEMMIQTISNMPIDSFDQLKAELIEIGTIVANTLVNAPEKP